MCVLYAPAYSACQGTCWGAATTEHVCVRPECWALTHALKLWVFCGLWSRLWLIQQRLRVCLRGFQVPADRQSAGMSCDQFFVITGSPHQPVAGTPAPLRLALDLLFQALLVVCMHGCLGVLHVAAQHGTLMCTFGWHHCHLTVGAFHNYCMHVGLLKARDCKSAGVATCCYAT